MTDNNFQIQSAAITDRGLSEKRPQNEDSFLEMSSLGLFAVADGVGGAQAGDVASQMAMEILGEAFVNLRSGGDAEEMMKIAIERANSAIYQMSSDLPQLSTMATTIVALHVSGNIATIGHVGDSRLYRLDSRGSLYRETQDHSVVEEEVRAGRMTAAQAANHPSRNVISRALGAESTVEVDMKTIMFDAATKFLLCSDGITRHIPDFEIRDLLLAGASPAEVCAKMKEICYSRGAEDNLTAVIVNIVQANVGETPSAAPAASFDEEATVATARAAATAETPVAFDENGFDEIPTRALEMPSSMQSSETVQTVPATENFNNSNDDESYLMEESEQEILQTAPETTEIPEAPAYAETAVNDAPAVAPPITVETRRDLTSVESENKNGSGFFGKLLSAIVWLVVGAIIGVAGYYAWLTMNAKPAEVPPLTPQSNNISQTSRDQLYFEAENNPEKVINQYQTALPKDASDFYILGRAYLNNKNYEEAKRNFILARNNLKAVSDPQTRKILATDITQGLTIAQDKAVQAAFERERKIINGEQPAEHQNTNTSSGGDTAASPAG